MPSWRPLPKASQAGSWAAKKRAPCGGPRRCAVGAGAGFRQSKVSQKLCSGHLVGCQPFDRRRHSLWRTDAAIFACVRSFSGSRNRFFRTEGRRRSGQPERLASPIENGSRSLAGMSPAHGHGRTVRRENHAGTARRPAIRPGRPGTPGRPDRQRQRSDPDARFFLHRGFRLVFRSIQEAAFRMHGEAQQGA